MSIISLNGASDSFDTDEVVQILFQGDVIGNSVLIIVLRDRAPVFASASNENISTILNAGFKIYQCKTKDRQTSVDVGEIPASLKHHKRNSPSGS